MPTTESLVSLPAEYKKTFESVDLILSSEMIVNWDKCSLTKNKKMIDDDFFKFSRFKIFNTQSLFTASSFDNRF